MAVTHDYKCPTHGYFENTEAKCLKKRCKQEVMLVFLQPPAYHNGSTAKADKTLNQLAMDFDMTNIRSAREGENQAGYYTRKNKTPTAPVHSESIPQKREPRPGDAAIWGGSNGGMDMKSILSGRYNRPVRDEPVGIRPKDAGNLTGPKAASYIADHENLQIKR